MSVRILALLIVVLGLSPGTWWRTVPDTPGKQSEIRVTNLPLPSAQVLAPHLGAFDLENVWQLESKGRRFGSYSALLAIDDSELLAFSDFGFSLRVSLPDPAQHEPRRTRVFSPLYKGKARRDVEAATFEPSTSTVWLALENINAIVRFAYRDGRFAINGVAAPPELARWSGNSGPESLLRLTDGRFIVLRESFVALSNSGQHEALLFGMDPVEDRVAQLFTLAGPAGFSPTDAAMLPDGRVLVLFRKLAWPLPARFSGRIAIGDPEDIEPGKTWRVREVAKLSSTLPVDNFEGMAVQPRADGWISVWLISDGNNSIFQRTLLWKMAVDPAELR